MPIGTFMMPFIYHNFIFQGHTTHFLACRCIRKGLYDQIVFLRNHHELHTFLPIAETVKLEVLTNKVCRSFFRNDTCQIANLKGLSTLLGPTCLNDIRVFLSHRCQK